MSGETRACPECRAVLPADPRDPKGAGFPVGHRRRDGSARYYGRCKRCRSAYHRRWRARRAGRNWEQVLVPIGPFRAWLERVVARGQVKLAAMEVGVDESYARDLLGTKPLWHDGRRYQRSRVTLGVVERWLDVLGDGTRVDDLYDLDEVEMIRRGER